MTLYHFSCDFSILFLSFWEDFFVLFFQTSKRRLRKKQPRDDVYDLRRAPGRCLKAKRIAGRPYGALKTLLRKQKGVATPAFSNRDVVWLSPAGVKEPEKSTCRSKCFFGLPLLGSNQRHRMICAGRPGGISKRNGAPGALTAL